jgi:hypothetical protein
LTGYVRDLRAPTRRAAVELVKTGVAELASVPLAAPILLRAAGRTDRAPRPRWP